MEREAFCQWEHLPKPVRQSSSLVVVPMRNDDTQGGNVMTTSVENVACYDLMCAECSIWQQCVLTRASQ